MKNDNGNGWRQQLIRELMGPLIRKHMYELVLRSKIFGESASVGLPGCQTVAAVSAEIVAAETVRLRAGP